jgi:hypothetical protein
MFCTYPNSSKCIKQHLCTQEPRWWQKITIYIYPTLIWQRKSNGSSSGNGVWYAIICPVPQVYHALHDLIPGKILTLILVPCRQHGHHSHVRSHVQPVRSKIDRDLVVRNQQTIFVNNSQDSRHVATSISKLIESCLESSLPRLQAHFHSLRSN